MCFTLASIAQRHPIWYMHSLRGEEIQMSIEPYFDDNGLCNDPYCPLCHPENEEYGGIEDDYAEEEDLEMD